jgi:hypothetical protein
MSTSNSLWTFSGSSTAGFIGGFILLALLFVEFCLKVEALGVVCLDFNNEEDPEFVWIGSDGRIVGNTVEF